MKHLFPAAVAVGALALAATESQAAERDQPSLNGTWVAVSAERDGKPALDVVGHRLTIEGSNFVVRSRGGLILYQGSFDRAAGRKGNIDFLHVKDPLRCKWWLGIFALDGNRLTICDNAANINGPRPTDFRTTAGSGRVLVRFDRTEQ